jgi:heat shock protein HslJ
MKGLRLVLLILTVGAVGCDESPTGPTELVDITWKLETVARVGSAIVTVPNPEQFTARFETNGTLSVKADCNSCTGRYVLDGSSVSIGNLACTLVACPTPGVDTLFTSALQNARTVTVSNDNLIMTGSEFTLRFRD